MCLGKNGIKAHGEVPGRMYEAQDLFDPSEHGVWDKQGCCFSSSPKDTREMEMGNRPFIQGNAHLLPPPSAAALSVTISQTKGKPLQHPQGKQLSPNHAQSAVTPLPHSLCLQQNFSFSVFTAKVLPCGGWKVPHRFIPLCTLGSSLFNRVRPQRKVEASKNQNRKGKEPTVTVPHLTASF